MRRLKDRPKGLFFHVEAKLRGESDGSEHPERIFAETSRRAANGANNPPAKILPAVERINYSFAPASDGVDREIATGQVFRYTFDKGNLGTPAAFTIPLGAKGGNLNEAAVDTDPDGPESFSCQERPSTRPTYLFLDIFGPVGRGEIVIHRFDTQQFIPQGSSDFVKRGNYFFDLLYNGVHANPYISFSILSTFYNGKKLYQLVLSLSNGNSVVETTCNFFLTIERLFYSVTFMKTKRTIDGVAKTIASFFREHRRMPTYSEMETLLGVRSKSVVHFWVQKLIRQGLLDKDDRGFLRLRSRSTALPLLGSIQAGFPSPAEEELCDILSLDEYLVARPEMSFLLRVSGDSMIEAGIMEGDLVIVERGRNPNNGDIVLAEVDGEWTMKYFLRKGSEVSLQAANPRYRRILPQSELRIAGIVTAVIRKYNR
jgi:SOS regulatory protein LexA